MSDSTSISWTDATWNPVRGCSRVSEGCRNCYAERVAARFSGPGQAYEGLADRDRRGSKWTGEVQLVPDHLEDPIRWQRPRRIFVNSMSDLFHENLEDEQIDLVLAAMLLAPRHTFQVLTKRATRMREYFENPDLYERVLDAADYFRRRRPELNQVGIGNPADSPARWIWLGVSIENQAAADERIPELLATPAAVRFLSCEPLLGAVDLRHVQNVERTFEIDALSGTHGVLRPHAGRGARIDWVIAGCESGPGARTCDAEWLRSLRNQCEAAGTAFFLKQAIEEGTNFGDDEGECTVLAGNGSRHKSGGVIELPYLDGVQHAAFPEVSR